MVSVLQSLSDHWRWIGGAALALCIAACASVPPAEQDRLVMLGDAEAGGETVAAIEIAREILAAPRPEETDALLGLAEFLAENDMPAEALAVYDAELTTAPLEDFSREIDLRARIAELAIDAGDDARAVQEIAAAVRLVAQHLGADHPRMSPILALAEANELDREEIEQRAGLESARITLAQSVARAREPVIAPQSVPRARSLGKGAVKEPPAFDLVDVYYATHRAAAPKPRWTFRERPVLDPKSHYGGSSGPLETGVVSVSVPRNRAVGEIPKPSVFSFDVRPDPARHLILGDMKLYSSTDAFYAAIKRDLTASKRQEIFVFIHGYNNDFATAIERTAQVSVDLEIDGVPVAYSWPSAGNVFSYKRDRHQVTQAHIDDLADFLVRLAEENETNRVQILAHSMGNEFLLGALKKLSERAPETPLFEDVVFASPDVDARDFSAAIPDLAPLSNRMTLYASSRDAALKASRRFNKSGRRAGESDEPIILPNLDTIDTSLGTFSGIGHSDIFGTAFPDFQALVWLGLEPQQRCILGKRTVKDTVAWVFGVPREDFCSTQAFTTAVTTARRTGLDAAVSTLEMRATGGGEGELDSATWKAAARIARSFAPVLAGSSE